MHKLVGSIIVMLASVYIGIGKYYQLSERKRILLLIRHGSEKIRSNLRCMCLPLYECFLLGGEFFSLAANEIESGMLPADALKKVANRLSPLKKSDKEIIFRFADGLSADDCKGQIANIELFISETDKNIKEAKEELNCRGQLFIKGSILSAAAVILLLI